MWRSWVVCAACSCAAGCVSSTTWSAVGRMERELAEEEERAPLAIASSCDEIAAHVVARFPSSRASRERARAALLRARSEGAPPAPELVLEVWDFPIGDPQLADREGMYMAGVSQEIPPAGSLDARARAASEEAAELIAEGDDRRREIRARALEACAEWSSSGNESARLRAAEAVLEQMREAMLGRMRAGAGSLADVARVEGEAARVRRMRIEAEARGGRAAARLRAWLGAELGEPPALAPLPAIDGIDAAIARAMEDRGALRAARARARAADARADAAEAEATVPTFTIRATYMQTPSARPGLGVALGMTLPWLWSGEGAARDAARADAEAEREELAALELDVSAEVRELAVELDAIALQLAELRERERPAGERALEALAAAYAAGTIELTAWLDAARALRELDVEEARLLGSAARTHAALVSALGDPR